MLRRKSNPYTRAVADFVSTVRPKDIPAPVLEHAKRDILDCLGCAFFGQTLPIAAALQRTYRRWASNGPAAIWGSDWDATPEIAALINGTLTHSFELDDLHAKAIIHPGGVTLAAALPIAQMNGLAGAELVCAHIIGLEVSSRVGLAAGVPILRRGWHNNGVLGVFGSSAAAANLLRLNSTLCVNALGTAGSLAAGLMGAQFGAMVKRLHAGQAAQSGLKAAMLAAEGFTGIETIFEEEYGGFLSTFSDQYQIEQVSADLGTRWETLNVGFKPYAACGSSHTTIDVMLDLKKRYGLTPHDVKQIQVTSSTATFKHVGWAYVPKSIVTAQMNLPFAVAVALLDGRVFVDQFTEERIHDPAVVDLARRVTVQADPSIDAKGAGHRHEVQVLVEKKDGSQLRGKAVHAKGSGHAPLSDSELLQKFLSLASKRISAERAKMLADTVLTLDQAKDLSPLVELLCVP